MLEFGKVNQELNLAVVARSSGNEGKMRVHARRAAGWAIRSYLQKDSDDRTGKSAFAYLEQVALDPSFPDEIREASSNLTVRITVEHQLPIETDIIDDARLVVSYFTDFM
tara:strand:+ start:7342 stop:7671 length:330 start_codon:yes stop_codon:yes gene_type:complete